MCMGPGLTHVKGPGCLGGQGKYLDEGFDGRHLERCYYYLPNTLYCRRERPSRRLQDLRHECVYGAGSEAVHLRAKSIWAPSCRGLALTGPCYADMLKRVEAIVSSISDAFDEYMMRAAIGTGVWTSSPPAPVVDTEALPLMVWFDLSFTPSPSIRAPGH
ncbi:hypothetical protein M9H77_23112 [Catharanthus roseus]|uniref:Uncharacterized protein n=1 Tax=Catharanthus roseus TaxID=4058 RepID=A0ACC0ASD3_CATRO|nr:hypothetical protein M9H77_23112 [Catharanthus roseus]